MIHLLSNADEVAPLVGAWIEINFLSLEHVPKLRRSSCRSVD